MNSLDSNSYLSDLNEAQRAAVCYNDGPALVIAGAGSGKTRVLVYKLLHLIHSGYSPNRLMALTFTNKAAREIRHRVERVVGRQAYSIRMGTFHSVFLQILRQHADLLGYTSNFSIYNTSDSKSKIKNIVKQLGLDDKAYKPGLVHARISNAKNRLQSPEAYRQNNEQIKLDTKANIPRVAEIYARYMSELRIANAMDFDDLLMQTNILFRSQPEVLRQWQESIDYLLIDEYQDTNFAQYMIARQLMQERGKIFVVGDDAQSIYSFRGANIENILSFQRTFTGAKLFKLEQNYRSTQTIVQAAKCLIAHNENQLPKEVFSLEEVGEPIELFEALSGEAEAIWVTRVIENARHQKRADYSDFAVLYRTNQQSRLLEQKLRSSGIPFRIWGGHSFFDYKEVMDVMAYFRLMINQQDDEALLRIINYPKRGIGDTTVQKLRQQASYHNMCISHILLDPESYGVDVNKGTLTKLQMFAQLLSKMRQKCSEETDLYQLAEWLINMSGIPHDLMLDTSSEGKDRRDNVQELLVSIDEYARSLQEEGLVPSLESYVNEISLMTDVEPSTDEEKSAVTLMTVHAAKGLEFPHVLIVGLEEQLFPSAMCVSQHELEEERRLFYVALTRAARACHISYARERFRNGRVETTRPSRFLTELPPNLLRRNADAMDTFRRQEYRRSAGGDYSSGGAIPTRFSMEGFMPSPSTSGRKVYLGRRESGGDSAVEPQHQKVGDLVLGCRVSHAKFGIGVLATLEGSGENIKATVAFESGETKKLLLRFAHLVVID